MDINEYMFNTRFSLEALKKHAARVAKLYGATQLGTKLYRMYLERYNPEAWYLTTPINTKLGAV